MSLLRRICAAFAPSTELSALSPRRKPSALYVREVVYRDSTADENGKQVDPADRDHRLSPDAGYDPSIEEPLVRAFSLAVQLPNLTSLRLVFDPKGPNDTLDEVNPYDPEGETGASMRLQCALLRSLGSFESLRASTPGLRALTLNNLSYRSR
ncbi:hypothetical protein FA95DRAFT_1609133 [Auriscalpium vulgare]|uniref:Uncharacterized protein n=1 Tax=Auriscalpium vulgare TaxID=40419 RepID=A0ACB8RIK1_9AGAM|nr:hypothetical protein FA95DRAFT_1609133 [Auriscalpium vulgare]